MRRVRRKAEKRQATNRAATRVKRAAQLPIPLDDGTLTTPGNAVTIAMIQALIPLGLRAVEEALQAEVTALAGERYGRGDEHPGGVRWGRQKGSVFLADQKLPLEVPRVRDREEKRILGLVQTATENKRRCASFLREIEERGFRVPEALQLILFD